jgi:vesicle coat complex subunit
MFVGYKLPSHFDFIRVLSAVSERQEEVKPLFNNIRKGLQIILPDSYFEKDRFFIEKEIEADRKLFDEIIEITYTSMNKKFIKQENIDEEEDEIKKMQKKAKMMAQKIRQKSKKDETSEEKSTKDFEDMLAAVLYEFPQYKLHDLFDLNIYTLHYLFRYVGKIANYEVSKIAAGNGLTKKHKYFIEK